MAGALSGPQVQMCDSHCLYFAAESVVGFQVDVVYVEKERRAMLDLVCIRDHPWWSFYSSRRGHLGLSLRPQSRSTSSSSNSQEAGPSYKTLIRKNSVRLTPLPVTIYHWSPFFSSCRCNPLTFTPVSG